MKITPRPPKKTRAEPIEGPPNDLECAECGGPMRLLQLVDNETNQRIGQFYGCRKYPACYCTHSAHADGTPMGKPGNAETRAARHDAHEVFDQLWKGAGRMTRAAAYRWLAAEFNALEVHMGSMDLEQCQRVIQLAGRKLTTLENERKRVEQRRKKANEFRKPRTALLADKKHRAARHEKKQERRQQKSDPPAAPAPEPEEEPPRFGRAERLELFGVYEEAGPIQLAEGWRLDDGDDLLDFEDEERTARQELWRRLPEEGKRKWRFGKGTCGTFTQTAGRS